MTKYLGIDYGLSHVGLATSESTLATPLPSLKNDVSLLSRLHSLIQSEKITHIICGLPEGRLDPLIRRFAHQLTKISGIKVVPHPETLSTQEAKQKLRESGANRTKRHNDHAYAACLILEDYLELTATS